MWQNKRRTKHEHYRNPCLTDEGDQRPRKGPCQRRVLLICKQRILQVWRKMHFRAQDLSRRCTAGIPITREGSYTWRSTTEMPCPLPRLCERKLQMGFHLWIPTHKAIAQQSPSTLLRKETRKSKMLSGGEARTLLRQKLLRAARQV